MQSTRTPHLNCHRLLANDVLHLFNHALGEEQVLYDLSKVRSRHVELILVLIILPTSKGPGHILHSGLQKSASTTGMATMQAVRHWYYKAWQCSGMQCNLMQHLCAALHLRNCYNRQTDTCELSKFSSTLHLRDAAGHLVGHT